MDKGIWSVTHKIGHAALKDGRFGGILFPPYPATSLINIKGKSNLAIFMDPDSPGMADPLHESAAIEVIDKGDVLAKLGLIF